MEQAFRDKIMPAQWIWCIINNLQKFDDKPEYIIDLIEKQKLVEDHNLLSSFANIFESVERFYKENNKFPDVAWLKLNFKGNTHIQESQDELSMQMYESLMRYIEQEYIKQEVEKKIVDRETPDLEDMRMIAKNISTFTDKVEDMPEETKDSLIHLYDKYAADFSGLKTHIKPIDDVIGVLGYKSLSVFAAPSGHGKSTFAFSVAYYAAIHGYCVDYLSFEIPSDHAWFNIMSIESEGTDHKIQSAAMKDKLLDKEEETYFHQHMRSFLAKVKARNGYLNILDQTTASINTYEGLCAKLESVAEKRGRAADLIIVDNIDNFQVLKSSERDESTKINNYIVSLDAFSKKYANGHGATILLLSQVNRPALKKLHTTEGEGGNDRKVKIDVTCIQKYNALYEKATCVLVGYADEVLRAGDTMKVYPVKLRNRGLPLKPIQLNVKFGYNKVRGEFPLDDCETQEEREQCVSDLINQTIGMSDEEANSLDDELQDIGFDE